MRLISEQTYAYAPFVHIEEWVRLGWIIGKPASVHSAFAYWLCDCPPPIPFRTGEGSRAVAEILHGGK
jgi:hypothetical protein